MGKNFKNINEELERMRTLMYETDNLVKNGTPLNEQVAEQKQDFKKVSGSIKLDQVTNVNTLLRGGAAKFPTYKLKGTGVLQFFDDKGNMTPDGVELMKKNGLDMTGKVGLLLGSKDKNDKDKVFFQVLDQANLFTATKDNQLVQIDPQKVDQAASTTQVAFGGKSADTATSKTDQAKPAGGRFGTLDLNNLRQYIGKDFGEVTRNLDPYKVREMSQVDLKKDPAFAQRIGIMDDKGNLTVDGQTEFYGYYGDDYTRPIVLFRVKSDNKISSAHKKGGAGGAMKESFNMNLIYVNPLLFESYINEEANEITAGANQDTENDPFECIGDCDDVKPIKPTPVAKSETKTETDWNPKGLKFGDNSEDVRELQQKLIDAGFLDPKRIKGGKATTYFGNLTQAALDKALGKTPSTGTTNGGGNKPTKPKDSDDGSTTNNVDSAWKDYPCIVNNKAMTPLKNNDGEIYAYADARNWYYNTGTWVDLTTKATGKYHCDGDTIHSDKEETTTTTPTPSTTDMHAIAEELFKALKGSDFVENEDAVYDIFQNKITSDGQLKELIKHYDNDYATLDNGKVVESNKLVPTIKDLFSTSELSLLNQYISVYSNFRF